MRASAHIVAIVAGFTLVGPLAGQEPLLEGRPAEDSSVLTDQAAAELDAEAADIAAQLRCPVCTGQSVLESNSGIAQEMQAVIREQLDEGKTEEEILAYFVGSYGDWIILKPRASGINLLVYILPALVVVAGGVWLVSRLRRWSMAGRAASSVDRASGLSEDDEQWLEEAVGRG